MRLQQNINRVLKEQTKFSPYILRRLIHLDEIVERIIQEMPPECYFFSTFYYFLRQVKSDAIERMFHIHLNQIDDGSNEWERLYIFMEEYIERKYANRLYKIYNDCVEYTKNLKEEKLVNKHIIKKIIREEVDKKYTKPNEKIEKLINNWFTKLFSDSKMYHIESSKSRHDFEWCKNGLQIAHLILFFDSDENVYDDKRPTKERAFTNGTLQIPKNNLQDLLDYIPLRRNYLRYKIEEWFEDNLMNEIKNKMGRNDLFIDEFDEYPKEPKVCVPPVEKPKDVSIEDMIEYLLKTTLYKREEIEKREEEEPGWMEKIYLSKLRDEKLDNN